MQEKRKGFWSNNWAWAVPLGGCGGCLLLVVGFVVLLGGGVIGMFRSSDAYENAVELARSNQAVIEALGEPIKTGWLPNGNISTSGSGGEADLTISLTGPKGKGTLYVVGTRRAMEWTFELLEVEIEATGERIDLLGGGTSISSPAEAAAEREVV